MVIYRYSKRNEVLEVTTFTMIITIAFVFVLVGLFIAAIEKDCPQLACLFASMIIAFAYLAKTLM